MDRGAGPRGVRRLSKLGPDNERVRALARRFRSPPAVLAQGPIDFPAYDYLVGVDAFLQDGPDSSSFLLELYDGIPRLQRLRRRYFSEAGDGYPLDAIAAIYRLTPLDAALVRCLNPERDLASPAEDVKEIGYPGEFAG